MGQYSIKELEQLSGIKAHTLRIWEKRYNLFSPSRTSTNIRYYNDDDLKKVINISILRKNGFKIGIISKYDEKDLSKKIEELHRLKSSPQLYEDQLLVAMIEMNEAKFEKLANNLILQYGFEKALIKYVFPFLEKVGLLWLTSNISPAHEHFLSSLVRQKIIVATDGLILNESRNSPKVLVFLPEHEMHELGILFYNYYLRKNHCHTIYLGQIVPLKDLGEIIEKYKPNALLTSISVDINDHTLEEFITQLSQLIPTATCYLTGYQLKNYKSQIPPNVHIFKSCEDLKVIFESSAS